MRQVRQVTPTELLEDTIAITANAYPGLELANHTNRERFRERLSQLDLDPSTSFYALFEEEQMRGVMRWHDFTMNFFGVQTLVGGLGGVAVDLLHKKEKIAAEMVQAFLWHYKNAGACLTALYPFRPDFYRRMGYGYGTLMNNYRFLPASLPKSGPKEDLQFLNSSDIERIHDCYDCYRQRTHGIMARRLQFWQAIMRDPGKQIIGVNRGDRLSGYLIFSFEKGGKDNFLSNNLTISELVYETAEDLSKLLTFLQTQADQIEEIIYNTQDDSFYYLLQDPRRSTGKMLPAVLYHESSTQGLGIMYRVINIPRLFEVLENHDFGGISCRLQIMLSDSFFPENTGSYIVEVIDGRARFAPEASREVTLSMDVAEFSSLVVGAVTLRKLADYGLAEISDRAYLARLDQMFSGPKPICLTSF